ncbi:Ribosome association toxin PasT (RatA) of the RatAB toxin-antitoxin module [Aeromonas sp. RU39B]|jgi:ribosome-associated toxin RatA of RatAB toxin-antitoxin module|uniref:SRPBCC family protein n=1 Tax=Aeromonas sp. RU39B TaxID=1907416 RepID=UPI00095680AB|nr:SRPBCC family protein [Aeromonas sp. RU39B]SIR40803.1 Ribosome association toxin PasT (RatA) of the RatAB toxin-antitoxin module [Aeromonas sp. RU39B]
MPRINRSALVMFSAEQMFTLVNDVKAYPQFLPGCVGSRVHEQGDDYMTASVDVAKAGIAKTFTTRNSLEGNHRIHMQLVDGPFSRLMGWWTFTPLDVDACKVEFELDFEFTNRLVEMAFGQVFRDLVNAMVNAFTLRAKEVYGA